MVMPHLAGAVGRISQRRTGRTKEATLPHSEDAVLAGQDGVLRVFCMGRQDGTGMPYEVPRTCVRRTHSAPFWDSKTGTAVEGRDVFSRLYRVLSKSWHPVQRLI